MKLRYDEMLPSFAFNFSLRRYNTGVIWLFFSHSTSCLKNAGRGHRKVGWCRLTLTKPVLKAPLV
jgi:hypothetical protein